MHSHHTYTVEVPGLPVKGPFESRVFAGIILKTWKQELCFIVKDRPLMKPAIVAHPLK